MGTLVSTPSSYRNIRSHVCSILSEPVNLYNHTYLSTHAAEPALMDVLVDPENMEICKVLRPLPQLQAQPAQRAPAHGPLLRTGRLREAQGPDSRQRLQLLRMRGLPEPRAQRRMVLHPRHRGEEGLTSPFIMKKMGFSGLLLELVEEPLEVDVLQRLPGEGPLLQRWEVAPVDRALLPVEDPDGDPVPPLPCPYVGFLEAR
jgi:hypothetical protein